MKLINLQLDDWVLCRIYKKCNTQRTMEVDGGAGGVDLTLNGILASPPPCRLYNHNHQLGLTSHEHNNVLFVNMLNAKSCEELLPSTAYTKMFLTDTSSMGTQPTTTTDGNYEAMAVSPGESILRQPYQLPDMNWYS